MALLGLCLELSFNDHTKVIKLLPAVPFCLQCACAGLWIAVFSLFVFFSLALPAEPFGLARSFFTLFRWHGTISNLSSLSLNFFFAEYAQCMVPYRCKLALSQTTLHFSRSISTSSRLVYNRGYRKSVSCSANRWFLVKCFRIWEQ